jgi:hypothetical protein
MTIETSVALRCDSTDKRAINKAKEFPARLLAIHQGRIVLRDTAVYLAAAKPIDVFCSVCGYEWSPVVSTLLKGHSCPECSRLNSIKSAGKLRCPRGTKEEKARAALLRSEGHTYKAIAEMLGRSSHGIQRWLDPKRAEKDSQRESKRLQDPVRREQHKAIKRRYSKEFEHGKEVIRKGNNKRRALMWEASFPVLLDGVWHEVEMMPYLQDWDDRQMFVDFQSCEDYAKLQATAKEMAEIHGEEFHIDHLVPLSCGGLHHTSNFKIVPASYNLSKNNKRIHEDEALFCKRIFNIN